MSQDNNQATDALAVKLHVAVRSNDAFEVRNLLSLGVEIEQRIGVLMITPDINRIMSYTPLSWACYYSRKDSHFETIETLLKNGANVNVTGDHEGDTPLHHMIFNNDVKTIQLLLNSYGPDLSIKNSSGESPLYSAARCGRFEIVKLLLDQGVDVNLVYPRNGFTPLHVVIYKICRNFDSELIFEDELKFAQLLLDRGADVNVVIDSLTPLHTACAYENLKIIKFLLKNGANLYAREKNGLTPLKYMLKNNGTESKKVLTFLLQHSNMNSIDSKDRNILYSCNGTSSSKVILEYFAIVMALDLPVDSDSATILLNKLNDKDYYNRCHCELELAENTKLKNSWITFFKLLVDSRKKLRNYAGNEDLVKDVKSNECLNKFPIYGPAMQKNIKKGIERRELFDKSTVLLTDYVPIFNPTHIIIRDILDCILSKKDLSKLCQ